MSLTVSLIAKLSRVDEAVVRRVLQTARSQDEMSAPPPAEFTRGREALAYALAIFMVRKPVHFVLGAGGMATFVIYMLIRLGGYFYGK